MCLTLIAGALFANKFLTFNGFIRLRTVIESRMKRRAERVASIKEKRNVYRILVGDA